MGCGRGSLPSVGDHRKEVVRDALRTFTGPLASASVVGLAVYVQGRVADRLRLDGFEAEQLVVVVLKGK